ncbi:MAG: hypothetical protein HY554_08265 [Elusimicrobia bacterium]|nr:hypothetical protein [Elusimicrobiota bacterium]
MALLLWAFLAVGGAAFAAESPPQAATQAGASSTASPRPKASPEGARDARPPASIKPRTRKERRRELDLRLKAEREERRRRVDEERRAFLASLDGLAREEKKARLAEFNAGQKAKLKEFRESQRAKRREFEERLKREPPLRRGKAEHAGDTGMSSGSD